MALEGTLKDFSLADIFQLIGLQRKTGVLTLKGRDDTVSVTFLDGKVVSADSLNRRLENRLGHVLIKTGTLTQVELNRALEIQRETLQRLGFILTHYGIISQDSLRSALQMQILQIIYRLFRWKDGEYHFSQETTIEYDRENVIPITAESILMEGARMIDEWPIIERRIRSYDMIFERTTPAGGPEITVGRPGEDDLEDTETRQRKSAASGVVRITEKEHAIYELVDGKRSVADIVESSRLSEFDTNKALYELLSHGVIGEVHAQAPSVLEIEVPAAEPEIVETSAVPLPLVVIVAVLAVLSLATSWKNPLNVTSATGRDSTSLGEIRKSISFQRIRTVGQAIEAYNLVHDDLPADLDRLVPTYISSDVLHDPWGHPYKFIQRPLKYLIIGFTPDGRPDSDLFFSRSTEAAAPAAPAAIPTGGITLID